jgi:hypothetical protein
MLLGGRYRTVLAHTLGLVVIQVRSSYFFNLSLPTFVMPGYGGFGFASRKWGLTLDTIKSINMVLANGTIITASSSQYSDIFWVNL